VAGKLFADAKIRESRLWLVRSGFLKGISRKILQESLIELL
jgi:hypothetical protein